MASTSDHMSELDPFRDALVRLLEGWGGAARPISDADQMRLWRELAGAGWAGLGGEPGDAALLALAMAELGAAGLAAPLVGAAAANGLLAGAGGTADILSALKAGEARIALALGALDGDPAAGAAVLEGGALHGTLGAVEGLETATHLLVLAGGTQACLAALPEALAGTTFTPGYADPPLGRVDLAGVAVQSWPVEPGRARRLADLVRLLLIARAWGAQRHGLALAIDYAGLRKQFGRAIGQFQAIQHKLADCRVRADLVEVLIDQAVRAQATDGDVERTTACLVSAGSPALRRNALEIQHVFGAVGYAADHEAARGFTRIHADTTRLGGVARARRVLARRLFDAPDRNAVFPIADEPEPMRALRGRVRAFLAEHWGPDVRSDPARNPDVDFPFMRALSAAGWLTANWPREHGGPGFDAFEQFAFIEEMRAGEAPMTLISPTCWVVAPAIIAMGSPALKAALLPGIAEARVTFALGYSEPQAGSDLAALATRAVRDGETYVVNGQKIWTSNTEYASHIFLAARTGGDPLADKHAGISVFVVPIGAPGVTVRRMRTLYGKSYASVFLDDVRVPAAMMVGGEGDGWKVLGAALGAERIIMGGQIASLQGLFASLVETLKQRGGVAADPVVWERLAELAAELEGARALSLRSIRLVDRGGSATIEGAIAKLYSGDLAERIGEAVLELCGVEASLSKGAQGALLDGAASQHLRTALMLVIGGGTAEIQRNVIAQRGLGLPR